jgi:type IV pilus biogenesis protein PilP
MKNIYLLTLAAFAIPAVAAQTPPEKDIATIQSATFVAKITAAMKEADARAGVATADASPRAGSVGPVSSTAAEAEPVAVGSFEANGVSMASVQMPNGRTVIVHAGDVLPGGKWRVASVGTSPDRTVITRVTPAKAKAHADR